MLSGGLDVTPLLGSAANAASLIAASDASRLVVEAVASPWGGAARLQVRGKAEGTATLSLVHSPAASVDVVVSGSAVAVGSLFVGALTEGLSELSLSPTGTLAPHAGLSATFVLRQQLSAEGNVAKLFAVANFSDGQRVALDLLLDQRHVHGDVRFALPVALDGLGDILRLAEHEGVDVIVHVVGGRVHPLRELVQVANSIGWSI